MFNRTSYGTAGMLAVGLMFATSLALAEHEKDVRSAKLECSANDIIGKKVKNLQDEDLGKIQDLIVNSESGTVPYAIIAHGGVLGAGRSKTAVPMDALRCSTDGKTYVLAATKEQLQAASKTPDGVWTGAAGSEWARNVDGFYGRPNERNRIDRVQGEPAPGDRSYVRDPAPKGAERLMTPADAALCQKVCENTDLVNIRVENGVTHVYGTVANEEERKNVEMKVRSIQGVNKVESHLRVKNQ
jgi:sporulation protein YlmC with PRC-barrel domain